MVITSYWALVPMTIFDTPTQKLFFNVTLVQNINTLFTVLSALNITYAIHLKM